MPRFALPLLLLLAACDTVGLDQAPVADAPAWDAMLTAVNEVRAQGATCGGEWHAPAQPLVWDARLEAAARHHSADMAQHSHFGHRGTDGAQTGDRVRRAGYDWRIVGENLARHQVSVRQAIGDWLESAPHCRQLMAPDMLEIGAAEVDGYWTQVFAVAR